MLPHSFCEACFAPRWMNSSISTLTPYLPLRFEHISLLFFGHPFQFFQCAGYLLYLLLVSFTLEYDGGQLRNGPRPEEQGELNFHFKRVAHARHHLSGQQGVSAQFEEVRVNADLFETERLGVNSGQDLFQIGPGSYESILERLEVPIRRGQGAAVDLAVGGEWEGVEDDEGWREPCNRGASA